MAVISRELQQALLENNLVVSENQLIQLSHYLELLTRWNRVFNLTAITQLKDMINLHIIDSLLISPYLNGSQMLDVGTGAGLPGMVLAISNPGHTWVLVDKNNKKTRFLTQACAELKLENVRVVHANCSQLIYEQLEKSQNLRSHPSGFDTIVSRAFGSLKMMVETNRHLLAKNGTLAAMKGKYPTEELIELPEDFRVEKIERITLAGINTNRHIVCLVKSI